MQYHVYLNSKDGPIIKEGYILDGIVPEGTIDLITDPNVDIKLDLCRQCPFSGIITHVMRKIPGREAYRKMCPMLFVDVFKPSWTVEDILK